MNLFINKIFLFTRRMKKTTRLFRSIKKVNIQDDESLSIYWRLAERVFKNWNSFIRSTRSLSFQASKVIHVAQQIQKCQKDSYIFQDQDHLIFTLTEGIQSLQAP